MRKFEYEDTPMADGLPSVTLGDVERAVADVSFTRLLKSDGTPSTTTVCHITLDNGFSVQGTSGCVVPEKFNEALGQEYAKERAMNEVWALLGYELNLKLQS